MSELTHLNTEKMSAEERARVAHLICHLQTGLGVLRRKSVEAIQKQKQVKGGLDQVLSELAAIKAKIGME